VEGGRKEGRKGEGCCVGKRWREGERETKDAEREGKGFCTRGSLALLDRGRSVRGVPSHVAPGDPFFRSLRLVFYLLRLIKKDALSPNLEVPGLETERNIEFWEAVRDGGRERVRRRETTLF